MVLRRLAILAGSAAMALALMALPQPAVAQDDCVGEKPRGGRAITSAEGWNEAQEALRRLSE